MIDSRSARSGAVIRRRRTCLRCGHRFTTYEEILRTKVRVVKRDGGYEDLNRAKLVSGIARACEKRPVSSEEIEAMVDAIVEELENEYERDVPTEAIGQKVMERLEQADEVAFVRFASVYRRFRDVNQFVSAIQDLVSRA